MNAVKRLLNRPALSQPYQVQELGKTHQGPPHSHAASYRIGCFNRVIDDNLRPGFLLSHRQKGPIVIACSALKREYRDILRGNQGSLHPSVLPETDYVASSPIFAGLYQQDSHPRLEPKAPGPHLVIFVSEQTPPENLWLLTAAYML